MDMPRLLVGTTEGLHELGSTERRALEGQEITALARDGARWWALVGGRALYIRDSAPRAAGPQPRDARRRAYRSDDGATWVEVATVPGAEATCLAAAPAGLWVGTTGAHLLRLDGTALVAVEAFDRVEGRAAWHTPWGDPADTRSMSVGPEGALYVNVHVGGVARSADGGRSWRPTLDIEHDVHQVLADPAVPGRVFAAAAVGLVVSEDGGERWRAETGGLHAHYARAVAVGQTMLLMSVSTGPRGRRAGLYRRPLASGGDFEPCREGLPASFDDNIDTHCVAAAGRVAALGTEDGQVFASPDEGRSWQRVAKGLPPVRGLAFA
jgi:hypothetical protein